MFEEERGGFFCCLQLWSCGPICTAAFCLVLLLSAFFAAWHCSDAIGQILKSKLSCWTGCFIATFINPLGWHVYEGLATVLGHFSQSYISEWWSYFWNMEVPGSIPGIVYILMFVALELRSRALCPIPLESRLLSWLFLFLGLYQFRYMSFFFMFSTVPLALHIDRLLPEQPNDFKVQRSLLAAGIVASMRSAVGFCTCRTGSCDFRNCFRSRMFVICKHIFRMRGC